MAPVGALFFIELMWIKNYILSILPGYWGCDFQYTPALEKNVNTLSLVGMNMKIGPPRQFAPLGP